MAHGFCPQQGEALANRWGLYMLHLLYKSEDDLVSKKVGQDSRQSPDNMYHILYIVRVAGFQSRLTLFVFSCHFYLRPVRTSEPVRGHICSGLRGPCTKDDTH